MKKKCSMAKLGKFIVAIILILSSTLMFSQKKIQWNGKAGIGLIESYNSSEYDFDIVNGETSALGFNLGITASYKRLEFELGYLKPFALLGRKLHQNHFHYYNPVLQTEQDPEVVINSNRLTSFQSIHMLLNVKLNLGAFHFKIGGGVTSNNVNESTRTTYMKSEDGIIEEIRTKNYGVSVPLQPMLRFSHVIGPYEISLTTLNQKSILYRDLAYQFRYSNIAISRYLIDESRNQKSINDQPAKERIISFTPGYKLYFPIGNGLPSGQSLFFEISKPIKTNWEITASIQGPISFNGYTKTDTPFDLTEDGDPKARNFNQLYRFIFYKLVISKIKKLSNNYSFLYGLGPTLNYKDAYENEYIPGVTAHASFYSPLVQYRLEFNLPFGDLPSHLSFGIGVPISIHKKSKEKDKTPVNLDNWKL